MDSKILRDWYSAMDIGKLMFFVIVLLGTNIRMEHFRTKVMLLSNTWAPHDRDCSPDLIGDFLINICSPFLLMCLLKHISAKSPLWRYHYITLLRQSNKDRGWLDTEIISLNYNHFLSLGEVKLLVVKIHDACFDVY